MLTVLGNPCPAATTVVPGLGTSDRKPWRRQWGTCSLTFRPWQAVNCTGREWRTKGLRESRPPPFRPSVVSRPIIAEQHMNVRPLWLPDCLFVIRTRLEVHLGAVNRLYACGRKRSRAIVRLAICSYVNINGDIECGGLVWFAGYLTCKANICSQSSAIFGDINSK